MSNPQQLVQKLWNYCNILRDDGLSSGDYVLRGAASVVGVGAGVSEEVVAIID